MDTATTHRLVGATVQATNRTFGLAPAREPGSPEIVVEVLDPYDLTVRTDAGNVYLNGDYRVLTAATDRAR